MTNTLFDLNAFQIGNLEKLATYLESHVPPPNFSMGSYYDTENHSDKDFYNLVPNPDQISEAYHDCGTAACAVGHGPLAGVSAEPGEDWNGYCYRCFTRGGGGIFLWLFESYWTSIDNTPAGAARRIRYLLKVGRVPDRFMMDVERRNYHIVFGSHTAAYCFEQLAAEGV